MEKMQIVPAAAGTKNVVVVEAQYVELMVPLYSHGCERKVKKTLSHLKGIYSVNVDYEKQKVIVWGICNKYDVLETVRGKRREARFWNHPEEEDQEDNNNNINVISSKSPSSSSPQHSHTPPKNNNSKPYNYITLIRAQSFKWNAALKKVFFTRSYSF